MSIPSAQALLALEQGIWLYEFSYNNKHIKNLSSLYHLYGVCVPALQFIYQKSALPDNKPEPLCKYIFCQLITEIQEY